MTASAARRPGIATAAPSAPPVSRLLWMVWAALCVLTLLNANSVAVLAGAPERIFNPLLLLAALGVVVLLAPMLGRFGRAPIPAVLIFALTFLLVGLFSATQGAAPHLEAAIGRVPLYLASLLLVTAGAAMAMRCVDGRDLDRMLIAVFWPLVLASLSGVLFVGVPAIGSRLALLPGERLHGVFGNVNELGGQAGYALLVGLVLTMRTKRPWWVLIGVLAGGVGVVSSFSKAAMVGYLPLLALTGYAATGARLTWRTVLIVLGASVLIAVFVVVVAQLLLDGSLGIELSTDQRLRLTAIYDLISTGALDEASTTGRAEIWAVGLERWTAAPIAGLGLTAFDRVTGVDMEIHNTILRVLGESGLIGAAAFVAMVAALVVATARHPRREIHVLGIGFLLVQLPALMSTGGIFVARNHNIMTGVVVGLLAAGASSFRATTDPVVGGAAVPPGER